MFLYKDKMYKQNHAAQNPMQTMFMMIPIEKVETVITMNNASNPPMARVIKRMRTQIGVLGFSVTGIKNSSIISRNSINQYPYYLS